MTEDTLTHSARAERRRRIADFCRRNTVAAACEHFGCSESLVRAACTAHGVATRKTDQSKLRLIAALVNTSAPFAELGRKHGMSRQAVEQLASRCLSAGLKVKDRSGSCL